MHDRIDALDAWKGDALAVEESRAEEDGCYINHRQLQSFQPTHEL